jgi:predicted transcriptional regulator
MDNPETRSELLGLTSKIVTAHLSTNSVAPADLPGMIKGVYGALANTIAPAEPPAEPAVAIKKSVTPNHIACLEDGKKFKMLKRHLRVSHSLSPEEYRAKWGLAVDYPMAAPAYAEQRSVLAKAAGLGKPRPKGRKKPMRKSAGRA